mgnify:CR=1 FL=1
MREKAGEFAAYLKEKGHPYVIGIISKRDGEGNPTDALCMVCGNELEVQILLNTLEDRVEESRNRQLFEIKGGCPTCG